MTPWKKRHDLGGEAEDGVDNLDSLGAPEAGEPPVLVVDYTNYTADASSYDSCPKPGVPEIGRPVAANRRADLGEYTSYTLVGRLGNGRADGLVAGAVEDYHDPCRRAFVGAP